MKKGFTLLELMIVIAIIAVIGMFVWLGLAQIGGTQALKNTTLTATTALRDAQQRSMVQQDGYYWGVQFDNIEGRDKFTLFRTATKAADIIRVINLTTMKPAVELIKPIKDEKLKIVFNQINGQLITNSCPNPAFFEEVEIGIVGKEDKSQIKIFCNGRVEFTK